MILESLILNNFRIYKGKQQINFAHGDKNITIIQGNNEVGKTTIMNAITWCLYRHEYYKKEGKKNLWNSAAAEELENGEENIVEVTLIMKDESGNEVTFKRSLGFFKNDTGKIIQGNHEFNITEDDGKNTKQYLSTETYLNKHLPEKLRKYFLFNGEQLEKFFDLGKTGNIRDSVDQLSQLNLLKRLVKHVGSIETTHISRGEKLEPNLTKIRRDIKAEEEKLQKNKDKLESLRKDKTDFKNQIGELETFISSVKGDPEKLMNERKGKEKELKQTIDDIKSADIEYKEFLLDKFFNIFAYESLNDFKEIGDDLKIKNFIPADIKKSFLKQLLDNKICICGEPLEEGSDHYKHIYDLFNDTNPVSDIQEEVNALLGKTDLIISNYPKDFKKELKDIKKYKKDLINKKERLNNRITEIDNILKNMDIDEINRVQDKLSSLRKSLETTIKEIGVLEKAIKDSDKKLKKLYGDEKEELTKKGKYDDNEKRLDFIKNINKICSNLKEEISEEMHEKLEKETSKLFTNMHWKTIYEHVEIDDNYRVTIYQKDGDINTAEDLSTGGTLTLALAFTLALNSLSGFELPIVIDTPMGNLDEDIQMNIAEFLPDYSQNKQVTLLVKSKEYTKEFRSEVIDHIGYEYKLSFSENQKGVTKVEPWS
ncbi:MAG: AAA family ATPase [Methanobrevibacter sp.]|nr:AAA family ATPase [Methanobrevibacter sp.]